MDVEQRARELLADEFARSGELVSEYADEVRSGITHPWDRAAIRAIIAALTPPQGYVLVPVQPTPEMMRAGNWRMNHIDQYKAMLAARPEVKP